MNTEMKQVAAALVKAKKQFDPALKNAQNPHLKNKYADLGSCLDAVDDALIANGIFMYQETSEDASGVTVETVFLHESGEELRCGRLHVPAPKQDPQGYGSALTYARRYSLVTSCGIAQEDDDGEAAKSKAQRQQLSVPAPRQDGGAGGSAHLSDKQKAFIFKLYHSHHITESERQSIDKRMEKGTCDGTKTIEWLQSEIAKRDSAEKEAAGHNELSLNTEPLPF